MPSFQSTNQSKSERLLPLPLSFNAQETRSEEESVPRHGQKTPGAFLNNTTRWPGQGRTSGIRCVIARVERVMDDGFCVFPI